MLLPIYQKYMGYEFSAVALDIWIVIVKLLFGFSVEKIEALFLDNLLFFSGLFVIKILF